MDNNIVVERAMKFAWNDAVKDYQDGRIIKYGSFFGRKYVLASFTVREPKDGKANILIDGVFNAKYENAFKATLWVDKNRDVLKDIEKRCLDQGIEYSHSKPKKESLFEEESVTLRFPIYLVQKEIERRDAEVRAFQDVLNTRRKVIVDALANEIIKSPYADTITSYGLVVYNGDTQSQTILSFADFGLEELDSGDKVQVLGEAVVAELNKKGNDRYTASRYDYATGPAVYTKLTIRKQSKPPEKAKLSKW